jgi:hypothetical protein
MEGLGVGPGFTDCLPVFHIAKAEPQPSVHRGAIAQWEVLDQAWEPLGELEHHHLVVPVLKSLGRKTPPKDAEEILRSSAKRLEVSRAASMR